MTRCGWVGTDPLMIDYHDTEWGVPLRDDRKLFEYMVLDLFQAGLSWRTILHKRAAFDKALAHFEPAVVAKMGPEDIERLLNDATIVRNRMKIEATIGNAGRVAKVQSEFGSLSDYLWQFVDGKALKHGYTLESQVGATSNESDAMSRDLKSRGFKFMGSTVCYAFMQGAGLVNDHLTDCFRYKQL